MKKSEEILEALRREGEQLEIPKGLEPEWMRDTLENYDRKQYFRRGQLYPILTAVACFCLVTVVSLRMYHNGLVFPRTEETGQMEETDSGTVASRKPSWSARDLFRQEERELLNLPEMTYEEIYEKMSDSWIEKDSIGGSEEVIRFEATMDDTAMDMVYSAKQELQKEAFGKTNVQVDKVDEADCVKNDGRYLYQIARKMPKETEQEEGSEGYEEVLGIQIVDTQDGLKEVAFLTEFENVEEFYVWEDLLITVENKYFESGDPVYLESAEDFASARKDVLYLTNRYHEISIYDISDRTKPEKLKTFTLEGNYETSRISNGYFYGISRFHAQPGEGESDYDAYIPSIDNKKLATERIYCPEEISGTSYLVLVSIDLKEPLKIADSRAILSGSGIYYVSEKNIYVAWYQSVYDYPEKQEGKVKDKTKLLRFSYGKGEFYAQGSGEIPGRLNDSFSLDEYGENLRAVTTVQEYTGKKVTDDRTGKELGYDYEEERQMNGLYILNQALSIQGKVEGLAEGETIYSARFLGDTGYFVTFRQVDPLFAVDLSDSKNPRVLGELKVSGFSEYLHFYGENLLLGIGMEVDEETGTQKGMKLSMFDLSDSTDLKEEAKCNLKDYNYSEALYNHRAVLIDLSENMIGFSAEGSNIGQYWQKYLVFSYENGEFVKKLELDTKEEEDYYGRSRGTFIGKVFYLLLENGNVRAYDRDSGTLLEKI
ncbi:MAG: hypothetical protein HFJ10_12085 [Lachnospiraceae bacterium]|nr:hypothetical protein [Lachnospiraceae bacterium]